MLDPDVRIKSGFYQSCMGIACATGNIEAGGRLLLRCLVVVVVVGVSEDQVLRR